MITLVTGHTGAGKTWFAFNKLLYQEWKNGSEIRTNQPATFPNNNERISEFTKLEEIYNDFGKIIFVDEAHKLFPAGGIDDFPPYFMDLITEHRKKRLDFVTTTQDIAQIHVNYRRLIHNLYEVSQIIRMPANERFLPIFQLIRVIHKRRSADADTHSIRWEKRKTSYYVISRLNPFQKKLYDTYQGVGLKTYICKLELKKGKWTFKMANRMMIKGKRTI